MNANPSPPELFGIEPFVGWRTWKVHKHGNGDLRLASLFYPAHWRYGHSVVGECRRPGLFTDKIAEDPCDPVPGDDCTCGIYAVHKPERAVSYLPLKLRNMGEAGGTNYVIGQVAMWGRVIEAERGFRAEYAYPVRLLVPYLFYTEGVDSKQAAARLARSYDVPVELFKHIEEFAPDYQPLRPLHRAHFLGGMWGVM